MNEKVLMNNVQPHKYLHIHMEPSSLFEATVTPSGLCVVVFLHFVLCKEK